MTKAETTPMPPTVVYITLPCNQSIVDVEGDMSDSCYLNRVDAETDCFQQNIQTLAQCELYYPPVGTPEFDICADNLPYETEKARKSLIKSIKPKALREKVEKISNMPVAELQELMAGAFDYESEGLLADLVADMDIVWFGVKELSVLSQFAGQFGGLVDDTLNNTANGRL